MSGALSASGIVLGGLSFTGSPDGTALLDAAELFVVFEALCGGAASCTSFAGSLGEIVSLCCPGTIVACLSFGGSLGATALAAEAALLGALGASVLVLPPSITVLSTARLASGGALGTTAPATAELFAVLVLLGA